MIARRLSSVFSRSRLSRSRNRADHRRPCTRRPAGVRGPECVWGPEGLEARTVMAVFTVVPPTAPVSAVNFRSLQEALAAAANTGDTIRISPNAVVDDLEISTKLSADVSAGATKIKAPRTVPFGQEVRLQEGPIDELVVVVGSQPVAGGLFELTLLKPLANTFTTAGGGTAIQTTGELAITKSVTLTSINGMLPATIGEVGLQVWADDVIFRNLLIGTEVDLMPGANGTFFRNCVLSDVADVVGATNEGRTFTDNVFFGDLTLRGDTDAAVFDRVLFNQFKDSSLRLVNNYGANVRGNSFDMIGADTAIRIEAGEGVVVRQNTITFTNPVGTGDPTPTNGSIGIQASGGGGGTKLNAQFVNNNLDTGGLGIGMLLDVNDAASAGENFSAKIQGNDFHWNAIGMLVDGERTATATALGTIDAGLGPLSSLGGNNFRGSTQAAASAGTAFAVYLANGGFATTDTVSAQNNLWTTAAPTQVVKDSANNTAAGGWAPGAGCGTVSVGGSQLSGNQQFVQSLYNEFLGRSASLTDVNFWATKIDLGTSTRQQVATSLIASQEAYSYYVDGLYHSILQRSPDVAGRDAWVSQLMAGASKESVAAGMTASDEYFSRLMLMSLESVPLPINRTGAVGDEAYVTSLYQKYLQRLPTNAEVNSWLAAGPMTSSRRLSTAQAILGSSEFRTVLVQDDLYYRTLNRRSPPSSTEVASWVNSGLPLTQLQIAFASTDEYFVNG